LTRHLAPKHHGTAKKSLEIAMDWKEFFEIIYYIAASIAALGTLTAGVFALCVYQKNSNLERAKWASQLYESFYQRDNLKGIRNKLDSTEDSQEVQELVASETPEFTDYLNFFEFIAFLKKTKQLGDSEVEDLFGYYLSCLARNTAVSRYVLDSKNGYEGLAQLIEKTK
jgi:hypothetical protein